MKQYFGTDGIRGRVGKIPITADWILKLGWAVGSVFAANNKKPSKIIIGKDTRISSHLFEAALQAGLISAGSSILRLGILPTPAIAFLGSYLFADAGIVVSASHNAFQDNGIKFFDGKGYKFSDAMELSIEAKWQEPFTMVEAEHLGQATQLHDAEHHYIKFCQNTFPKQQTLKGMKIVLDCANGATYKVAPLIFASLGAEIIETAVQPDGFNINDNCGATHPEILAQKVKETKADLGIAFDGDGDRVIMVDNRGEILDGDELLFIIAKAYAKQNRIQGGIVGTLMSNFGLEEAIKRLGYPFARVSVGDHYILERALKDKWNLGGETSGHILCLDHHTTGDGIISALQVLSASLLLGLPLAEIKKEMIKYPQKIINVPLTANAAFANGSSNITQEMKENFLGSQNLKQAILAAEANLAGKGRVLVRASGTEPLIRVMVEGENSLLVQKLAAELANTLSDNNMNMQ